MRKLGKFTEHRISMLKNLCISLIKYGKITTTLHRAKETRSMIEKMITRAKIGSLFNRRVLLSRLHNNEEVVRKLLLIGERNQSRPGGYIRILKNGFRNDGSPLAYLEIIDYN